MVRVRDKARQPAAVRAVRRCTFRGVQAADPASLPQFEVIEGRVLLSGYALSQVANLGGNSTGVAPESTLVADVGGNLYGTASSGGTWGLGTAFEIAKGSNAITVLASFNGTNGSSPYAGVTLDAAGDLFGTTYGGGASGNGTIFEIASGSNALTSLASFNGANGAQPVGPVSLDASGNLYGTTNGGGANNLGAVFELAKSSRGITTLASFNNTNGKYGRGSVALDASGNLFGASYQGGATNDGTLFEVARGSNAITTLASFNYATTGRWPLGGITLDSSGNLYGTTSDGGGTGVYGTVFEIAAGSTTISTLATLSASTGDTPDGPVTLDAAGNLYSTNRFGGTSNYGTVFKVTTGSSSATMLASFNTPDGIDPIGGVIFDAAGSLYGTALGGGANNAGTVFEIANGSNAITTLAAFDPMGGSNPQAAPTLDASGNLFGTTHSGGTAGRGTVYEIARGSNTATTLASFSSIVGNYLQGPVTLDASGNLYGVTPYGGTSNYGIVYEVAAGSEAITTIASFNGTNGSTPQGAVTFDAAGNLYGTTYGGTSGGTVFEIANGSNALTTLASLGGHAYAGVTLDAAGAIFGTTTNTVFEIAHGSAAVTTLASFTGPFAATIDGWITLDASGNLYGTTYNGGANSDGTVFEIAAGSQTATTLATFNGTNGKDPKAGVTLDAAGNLFGTTFFGGTLDNGTVFEIASGSNTITTLSSFDVPGMGSEPYGGVTLNATGDLFVAGSKLGNVFELSPVPTVTLAPAGGSNPSILNQPLMFTATVTSGVPAGETVTLVDTSNNNNAVVATGTLIGGSATLTIPAGTLSVGTHNLIAVYAGDANFADSESAAYTQTVQAAPPPPALTGAPVINGDNPNGLFNAPGQPTPGVQRSMVEDIVYTFNEPVTIPDANAAFTVVGTGPHPGTAPSTLLATAVPGTSGTQWAVSLTGKADGVLASIANGEYSITINPSAVFAAADGTTAMTAGETDTFYRLFGDINGDRVVNVSDEFQFSKAMNTYTPIFDVNGDGAINLADEFQASKSFSSGGYVDDGFVTTI
jgi:uncharacterized repeat protein (TIGR03803 family)